MAQKILDQCTKDLRHRPGLSNTAAWGMGCFSVKDLGSWWKLMTDDSTVVVVHGGREEIRFCLRFAGERPTRLSDVQIAEGLQSRSARPIR